jgi:glutathione S-transferase
MKLYWHPISSSARRASMAAHLLGLNVEHVMVDLQKGAQRDPQFLSMNPNGKVPTLVDGDLVLWESMAIMLHLADKAQPTPHYPASHKPHIHQWLFWTSAHWSPPIGKLNFERMLKKMMNLGEPDAGAVAQAEKELHVVGKILDDALAGKTWLCGTSVPTLADVAVGVSMMTLHISQLPLQGYPNLMAWFGRMQELPSWKATEPQR